MVREQAPREALIVYRHFKPIRARLRLYFQDTALKDLSGAAGAATMSPRRLPRPRWPRRTAA